MKAKRSPWRVAIAMMIVVVSVFGNGMADPPVDSDGDGVPDLRDKCPRTPAGVQVNQFGCSNVQLALGGHRMIIADAVAAAMLAQRSVAGHRELESQSAGMSAAMTRMDAAALPLEQGRLCEGAAEFEAGLRAFETEVRDVRAIVAEMIPPLLRADPTARAYGDADENDAKVAELELAESFAQDALDRLSEVAPVVGEPCAAIARRAVAFERRVASIDESSGIGRFDDGTAFVLPRHLEGADVFVGGTARGIGTQLRDGTIWPDSIGTSGGNATVNPSILDLYPQPCMALRIAPYQDFYWNVQPATLHPLTGYDRDGLVWMEDEMRFAAQNTCAQNTAPSTPQLGFVKRTLKVEIQYKKPSTGETKVYTVAHYLGHGDAPVSFPKWLASTTNAQNRKLIYTERKQSCLFTGLNQTTCGAPVNVLTTTRPLGILALGAYCSAQYQNDTFTLEDDDTTGYESTKVTGIVTPWIVQPEVQNKWFEALGYRVVNGVSSRPNVQVVTQNQSFAIYNDDFADSMFSTGTTKRSGLMWPTVKGFASNSPFQYSCTLPDITRDAVSICNQNAEHAYYRVPFGPGVWQVTQGNNQPFTHNGNQAFAFDWGADENTEIRAARGGVVWSVEESMTQNCYPQKGCSANKLVILHADGTYGIYLHMPTNGILVSKGQKVYRGDVVALVGNTGYSTGPHLHFHVKDVAGGPTIRHRYELITMAFVQVECYIPATGEYVLSNNT